MPEQDDALIEQYRRERKRAQILAAIHEAGREIAASPDLERTLRLVMGKAAETLPLDAAALFVYDAETNLYRVIVSHNLPPDQVDKITFAFDEGVPGWVVRHRQPLLIRDAPKDPRVHPYVIEAGVQAVVAIPLITHRQVVGVLNLFCWEDAAVFDQETVQLAQVFADQAAVFIENAHLVDELRRWTAALETRVEERTRQLQEKQAQVLRAEKLAAVGRLAASVAHEINNPLQAIALHLQLVEELDEEDRRRIQIVQQELDRIADIVQRLLDFQKPKEGKQTRLAIPALIEEVLTLSGKQVQRAGVAVDYEAMDEIPSVYGVSGQLKQVFLNLILNATEAMGSNDPLQRGTLTIRVYATDEPQESVIVEFSDTGPGIDPAVMAQLFEPFFTTKHDGSGLGLAVSHEIVTAHGGALQAANAPGAGATFAVTLPAAPAA